MSGSKGSSVHSVGGGETASDFNFILFLAKHFNGDHQHAETRRNWKWERDYKEKPVFVKVNELKPGTKGHNLTVKVVSSTTVLDKKSLRNSGNTRIAECLIGDDTASILFTARNDQVQMSGSEGSSVHSVGGGDTAPGTNKKGKANVSRTSLILWHAHHNDAAAVRKLLNEDRSLVHARPGIMIIGLRFFLLPSRVKLVRLGHPARLLPQVLESALDAQVLRGDNSALAKDICKEMKALNVKLLKAKDKNTRRDIRK